MALLALDLLARIVAMRIDAGPPFLALFTLWLSIMAAVGLASRSAFLRHRCLPSPFDRLRSASIAPTIAPIFRLRSPPKRLRSASIAMLFHPPYPLWRKRPPRGRFAGTRRPLRPHPQTRHFFLICRPGAASRARRRIRWR